jgi:hypothetical protein
VYFRSEKDLEVGNPLLFAELKSLTPHVWSFSVVGGRILWWMISAGPGTVSHRPRQTMSDGQVIMTRHGLSLHTRINEIDHQVI